MERASCEPMSVICPGSHNYCELLNQIKKDLEKCTYNGSDCTPGLFFSFVVFLYVKDSCKGPKIGPPVL